MHARPRAPIARPGGASALVATLAVAASLILAGCGDSEPPFAQAPEVPASTAPGDAAVPGTEPGAAVDGPPLPDPLPANPGSAPGPGGTVPAPPTVSADGKVRRPETAEERIAADQTAMLNARTMVSVVEGCHSGRDTYKSCNSHEDLGSAEQLGLAIGKRRGQVQISASDNGFRITARSLSGAKFTVARGPKGDRFQCLPGDEPGACPPDGTWSW